MYYRINNCCYDGVHPSNHQKGFILHQRPGGLHFDFRAKVFVGTATIGLKIAFDDVTRDMRVGVL